MAYVTKLKLNIQSGTTRTIYASWTFSKSHLDNFKVVWTYKIASTNVVFSGSDTTVTSSYRSAIYNPPENATSVSCAVTPVAKKHKVKGKNTAYWSGTKKTATYQFPNTPPDKPAKPSIAFDGKKNELTVTVSVPNPNKLKLSVAGWIYFQKNTIWKTVTAANVGFKTDNPAVFTIKYGNVPTSSVLTCKFFGYNTATRAQSAVSELSEEVRSIPGVPAQITYKPLSKDSLQVHWTAVSGADTYVVEYTTNELYFDSSPGAVSSVTLKHPTLYAELLNLEQGKTWYIRVRAENEAGQGKFSKVLSMNTGAKPLAPTAWTYQSIFSESTGIVFYFVHNATDNSDLTLAELEILENGSTTPVVFRRSVTETPEWKATADEDGTNQVYRWQIAPLQTWADRSPLKWRLRTRGIVSEFGPYSDYRTIHVYRPAHSYIQITSLYDEEQNRIYSLPITFRVGVTADQANVVSHEITVMSLHDYSVLDGQGNTVSVSAGEEIYHKIIASTENSFEHSLDAGDITLLDGETYMLQVRTMLSNAGEPATAQYEFVMDLYDDESLYDIDGSVTVDEETLVASITPVCTKMDHPDNSLLLSVYRRNVDGSMTLISSDIQNGLGTTVIDPHPALDYARYRIVAMDKNTSRNVYTDLPDYPVLITDLVLNWDEQWQDQSYESEDESETPSVIGKLLRLPYNVNLSETASLDTNLVSYIGRKSPVSYYGTIENLSISYNADIAKDDSEAILLLKSLNVYPGDCYVRDQTGNGFWANVNATMSVSHNNPVVSVSISAKKVDGGA